MIQKVLREAIYEQTSETKRHHVRLVGDDLARTTTTRTVGAATVRYEQRQESNGVPVYGAGVVVMVSKRPGCVMSYVASTYKPEASTLLEEEEEEMNVSPAASTTTTTNRW